MQDDSDRPGPIGVPARWNRIGGGMEGRLERLCLERGIRVSEQRRLILQVLEGVEGHPSAEEVHRRVSAIDSYVSLATVYRTLNVLADVGLLSRLQFGDGRAHYEEADRGHHEHLIDVDTGQVLEFCDDDIETVLKRAAVRLGYRLVEYRLEVFGASTDSLEKIPARKARSSVKQPSDTKPALRLRAGASRPEQVVAAGKSVRGPRIPMRA